MFKKYKNKILINHLDELSELDIENFKSISNYKNHYFDVKKFMN